MQTLADFIASILRGPGLWLRELSLAIPMSVARGFFLLYFFILLIWVLRMKKSATSGELSGISKPVDLRPYAAMLLIIQIVIYIVF